MHMFGVVNVPLNLSDQYECKHASKYHITPKKNGQSSYVNKKQNKKHYGVFREQRIEFKCEHLVIQITLKRQSIQALVSWAAWALRDDKFRHPKQDPNCPQRDRLRSGDSEGQDIWLHSHRRARLKVGHRLPVGRQSGQLGPTLPCRLLPPAPRVFTTGLSLCTPLPPTHVTLWQAFVTLCSSS